MKRDRIYLSAIIVATCICYGRMLGHEWLNYDDRWLVVDNSLLKQFSGENLQKVFFDLSKETRMILGAEYLPIRDLSVIADHVLWGDNATGFLFTNLILYLGAITFFYFLIKQHQKSEFASFFCALVFAIHPVHVESVAWAASRKDVLCLFFFFACIGAMERYLSQDKLRWLLSASVLYVLALASKYLAVVGLGYLLLRLLWIYLFDKQHFDSKRTAIALVVFSTITVLFSVIILTVSHSVKMTGYSISGGPFDVFLTVMNILGRYVFNLVFPVFLSPVYDIPKIDTCTAIFGWLFFFMFFALTMLLLIRALRHPRNKEKARVPFWLLWFCLALLPTSQIFSIQNKMADRYLLFASWSMAMLLPIFADHLKKPILKYGLQTAFVCFLGIMCFRQVGFWKNNLSLWNRSVEVEPSAALGWYQLAVAERDIGLFAEEKKSLTELLKLDPNHEKGLNNYAIHLYRRENNPRIAALVYERLLKIHSNNPKVLSNFGYVLTDLSLYSEAVALFERALIIDPGYCIAKNNLGRVYLAMGQTRAAKAQFEKALKCNPHMKSAQDNLSILEKRF